MPPLAIDSSDRRNRARIDDEVESGPWKEVVRHELAGGLSMKVRFLRAMSRDREAKLLGFNPKNNAVFCIQIKFENRYVSFIISCLVCCQGYMYLMIELYFH